MKTREEILEHIAFYNKQIDEFKNEIEIIETNSKVEITRIMSIISTLNIRVDMLALVLN
jgi:hypothetical protein